MTSLTFQFLDSFPEGYRDEVLDRWTAWAQRGDAQPLAEARVAAQRNWDRREQMTEAVHVAHILRGDVVVGSCLLEHSVDSPGAPLVVADMVTTTTVDPLELTNLLVDTARLRGAPSVQVNRLAGDPLSTSVCAARPSTVNASRMVCFLEQRDFPATSVELVTMSGDEYDDFERELITSYADDMAASGMLTIEAARETSLRQTRELLPQGSSTPGLFVFSARVNGVRVGILWVGVTIDSDGPRSYVYNVEIDPDRRGEGLGRAVMLAAERHALEHGCRLIALNVFGFNDVARNLYVSLGYEQLWDIVTIPAE